MFIMATRRERGLYEVVYPPDHNPDDALLVVGYSTGTVLTPDGYKVEQRIDNKVTYRIRESVTAELLTGGYNSVWAYVPDPFLVHAPVKAKRQPKARA